MRFNTTIGRNALLALGAIALALVPWVDRAWTLWLRQHRWSRLDRFMDRTLFEGEWIGGGDPVVILLILAAMGYYLAWKGYFRAAIERWRPHFGFALTCALITALQMVHSLKWIIGRARPREVFEKGMAFSHWFEFGPHFVTEGIYRGSFPSGHTAQVFILMALAYILAADPQLSKRTRRWGWCWGALALAYTLVMGVGRCMSFSHWLSDVVGALTMSWVGMHLIYFHLLRVPEQTDFYRRWGRHPRQPLVWEIQICFWCCGLFVGAMGLFLGLRAAIYAEVWLATVLPSLGLVLGWVCYRRLRALLVIVRQSYKIHSHSQQSFAQPSEPTPNCSP
jgi:membrane-associated phospholipid phosphatase